MTQTVAELLALANESVEESGIDLNEAVKGGGSGRLLPVGYAFGRLVEYIEYGNQPQEYMGAAKDPALEYSLGFALWGTAPNGELYHNADGTPYIIRTYNDKISNNEKARSFKLFKLLNTKGAAKGFAQLVNECFLVKIHHVPKSQTDKTIVSRIDLAGFLPPVDPVTLVPYGIPEAPVELFRMFLWNRPTKATWDKLFIEGTYEAKDGKPAESKNRIQEQILAALNFQGSSLQQLLLNSGVTALPGAVVAPVAAPVKAPVVAVATPLAAVPVVAPVVASVPVVEGTAGPAVASVPNVAAVVAAAPVVSAVPVQTEAVAAVPAALPVLPA